MNETCHAESNRDKSKRQLPAGKWVHISNLPSGYTAEQLSQFLCKHGLGTEVERISVRQKGSRTEAMVSLNHSILPMLVTWVINGDRIDGREVIVTEVGSSREGRQ